MTAGSQPRVLYAANARVWAEEISRQTGRPAGLQDIADRQLDALRELGVDLLWLIGMWPTGPASTDTARRYPGLEADYRRALPDFTPADVAGSPYAIAGYGVDPQLGGESGLAALRARLHRRGIGLVLDFVVNHTGLDHPWLRDRPELYVQGNAQDLQRDPGGYFSIDTNAGPKVIAHGRDPYFPAWTDTAQLNLLLPATQDALTAELVKLAGQCDGVRCDMAMLALPSLFRQVWPAQQPAAESFWPGAIAAVRRRAEDFTFIAEVYWGREDELRQAGFRFTYDKTLHERLLHGDAGAVRAHLNADPAWQNGCVRFLETHDEVRIATALPVDRHQAAAVVMSTVPGLSLLHDGQLDGRTIKTPIQLRRRPDEAGDEQIRGFYRRLLRTLADDAVIRRGTWRLLGARPAWADNPTWRNFIASLWQSEQGLRLIVANFAPTGSQCYLDLPSAALPAGGDVAFNDLLAMGNGGHYRYPQAQMERQGLYLDMPAYGFHLFDVRAA